MRIAFATSRDLPELTRDDRLAAAELASRGIEVAPAIWNDTDVDWRSFQAVVVRSTWDYHTRFREFLDWLDRLDAKCVRLINDTAIMRWNADKRYLGHFATRGLDVIPTEYVDEGADAVLIDILRKKRWSEVVVKPVVSATAYKTWRSSLATAADDQREFEKLVRAGGVMVQPFVAEIESQGEWSFQFFGGVFSHAVIKRAREGEYRVQVEYGGSIDAVVPPDSLLKQATRFILELPMTPDYARVDAVAVGDRLRLMELELIEPDLHFRHHPGAVKLFADRVGQVLEATANAN